MAAPKKIDYEQIEPDWRAGILSPTQLATKYTESTGISVSHAAIIKHFKKAGTPRDLAAKIKAKADAMVTSAMVTGKVQSKPSISESEIIDANAANQANIRIEQCVDIKRTRGLATKLLSELESTTDNLELFKQLGELLASPDEKGMDKLGEIYRKVMSLPGRIKAMKELADTLRILIELERKVYKMEDAPSENPLADLIKRVYGNSLPIAPAIEGEYEEVDG